MSRNSGRGGSISETPLTSVEGWTDDLVATMSRSWVTTAEQVVGIAQTSTGLQSIAEQLQTDIRTVGILVGAARTALSADTLREIEQPSDDSDLGLGALPPYTE